MRLPAPRARRRSTVLGEPFLRAVSTGATNAAEPPQPAETPEPQPLEPFRAMFNLFNACQQADAEIAGIEETLAVDPDALPPEAIVAPTNCANKARMTLEPSLRIPSSPIPISYSSGRLFIGASHSASLIAGILPALRLVCDLCFRNRDSATHC